ncbi:precorrin-3B synthase [Paraburkholderia xenovorans]|uniref:precorrin-3B synthase n=1 Tax=Paraburkholderia xenovorans TaxID=36873 RepID=UPI0038B6FB7C
MSVLNLAAPSTALPDAAFALRPSACPGLLRIVAARDGGLCRIKLPGGVLSAQQAVAIAAASVRHAAGGVEITNRANLQVRGVRGGEEAKLIAALVDAGLGPLPGRVAGSGSRGSDETSAADMQLTSAADDVRNVMISPAAGRDPFALFDTRPLCAELLVLLQSDARFAALSPKFALLLDGGERLARVDHPHDVWLAATQTQDGVRFVLGLAGCPSMTLNARTGIAKQAASGRPGASTATPNARDSIALAAVLPSQVPALIHALLHTFLDLAAADATRMRDLLAAHSIDAVLQHAQRYVDFDLTRDTSLADWHRSTPADPALRLGAHAQRMPGTWHVGAQPPPGRLDAATLHALAALAHEHGNGTLHMTPWQSVLLPDIATHATRAVVTALQTLGLTCDPAHPLARLIACTGSSGCAKGLADTQADARLLAARLPDGVDVHLSGCPRSCAAAHRAPYTLLAVARGLYDLYRRDASPDFGRRVAQQLTLEQAAAMLEQLARSPLDA